MAHTQHDPYADMLDLPHHVSHTRPQMSMHDRAAQFSPFQALTGYGAAIQETGRLTDHRIELAEDRRGELDRIQQKLMGMLPAPPTVTVTYFVPDLRKEGGAYITVTGCVKTICSHRRYLQLADATRIPLDDILDLNIHLQDLER